MPSSNCLRNQCLEYGLKNSKTKKHQIIATDQGTKPFWFAEAVSAQICKPEAFLWPPPPPPPSNQPSTSFRFQKNSSDVFNTHWVHCHSHRVQTRRKEQLLLLSLPQVKHQEWEPPTRSMWKHQHSTCCSLQWSRIPLLIFYSSLTPCLLTASKDEQR